MIKSELVRAVAEKVGISSVEARPVVETVFDSIIKALAEGEGSTVTIRGFGRFAAKIHRARSGRNPLTGERVEIPAKIRVRFKAAFSVEEGLS